MTQFPNILKKHPLLQLLQWIRDPIEYLEEARRLQGNIFTSTLGNLGKFVMIADPKANQQMLNVDRKQFLALGKLNRIFEPLVGDRSIFFLDGEEHRQRRKLIMPSFHGERMQNYAQLIVDLTEKTFDSLPADSPFTARRITEAISLQVIIQAIFGLFEGERSQELRQSISQFANFFNTPWNSAFLFFEGLRRDWGVWSPWGRFIALRKQIDSLLFAEIADRRQNPDPDRTDILSLLLSTTDEEGRYLSDSELRDELMTLLLAGHETTATALAWALYWIHHHPEIYQKLRQELDSLGENPDPLAVSRLPYLTAVCNETLRIYPVGILTFSRVVAKPTEMLGHRLEPNMVLTGCIYLTHHREDIYPEPDSFKPERFLERQFSPYEFIPFGGGARRCAGEALAIFELKLVLATIINRYRLELENKQPEKAQRRGLTLAPASGVKMVFKGRI
jgi:unspecific monooxygenase